MDVDWLSRLRFGEAVGDAGLMDAMTTTGLQVKMIEVAWEYIEISGCRGASRGPF